MGAERGGTYEGKAVRRIRAIADRQPSLVREHIGRLGLTDIQRRLLESYVLAEPRIGYTEAAQQAKTTRDSIGCHLVAIERKLLAFEAERNGAYVEDEELLERARATGATTPYQLLAANSALCKELNTRGLFDALFIYPAREDARYLFKLGPAIPAVSAGGSEAGRGDLRMPGRELVAELMEGKRGTALLQEAWEHMSEAEKLILTDNWMTDSPASLQEMRLELNASVSRQRLNQIEERLLQRLAALTQANKIGDVWRIKKKTITESARELIARLSRKVDGTKPLEKARAGMDERERIILEERWVKDTPADRGTVGGLFTKKAGKDRVRTLEYALYKKLLKFEETDRFDRFGTTKPERKFRFQSDPVQNPEHETGNIGQKAGD